VYTSVPRNALYNNPIAAWMRKIVKIMVMLVMNRVTCLSYMKVALEIRKIVMKGHPRLTLLSHLTQVPLRDLCLRVRHTVRA
jgi:hypothetical protein